MPQQTPSNCRRCSIELVPDPAWRRMTLDQRAAAKAAGIAKHNGRGLCRACYEWVKAHADLIDYEPNQVPAAVVAEEWEHLRNPRGSRMQQIREVAPRMGMSVPALHAALLRMAA